MNKQQQQQRDNIGMRDMENLLYWTQTNTFLCRSWWDLIGKRECVYSHAQKWRDTRTDFGKSPADPT